MRLRQHGEGRCVTTCCRRAARPGARATRPARARRACWSAGCPCAGSTTASGSSGCSACSGPVSLEG
eukprot:13209081-Heterocapsa_arctica.AAC.1